MPVIIDGIGHGLGEGRRNLAPAFPVKWRTAEDSKLVSAQPADGLLFSARRSQAFRHLAEDHISDRMTVIVVDFLEAVEIDQQEMHRPFFVAGRVDGLPNRARS